MAKVLIPTLELFRRNKKGELESSDISSTALGKMKLEHIFSAESLLS